MADFGPADEVVAMLKALNLNGDAGGQVVFSGQQAVAENLVPLDRKSAMQIGASLGAKLKALTSWAPEDVYPFLTSVKGVLTVMGGQPALRIYAAKPLTTSDNISADILLGEFILQLLDPTLLAVKFDYREGLILDDPMYRFLHRNSSLEVVTITGFSFSDDGRFRDLCNALGSRVHILAISICVPGLLPRLLAGRAALRELHIQRDVNWASERPARIPRADFEALSSIGGQLTGLSLELGYLAKDPSGNGAISLSS